MKTRRGIIRGCPRERPGTGRRAVSSRSRRLPHLRHLWDPPGGVESESAKRDATVRDSEEQKVTAPASLASHLPPRCPEPPGAPSEAPSEAGAKREEVPLRPRRSCLSRGPDQPHPGRAASLSRLPGPSAGQAPPAASRLSSPSLPCPGRVALVLCFSAIVSLLQEKLHLPIDSLQQVLKHPQDEVCKKSVPINMKGILSQH